MRRFALALALALAVAVLGLAAGGAALAATQYRLFAASVEKHPARNALFNVSAHGSAHDKVRLYVFLDRNTCLSTQTAEEARVNSKTFTPGDPYFKKRGKKSGVTSLWAQGKFYNAFDAYAGGTDEVEYVCAYLTTPNARGKYVVTAAHALARYIVTN